MLVARYKDIMYLTSCSFTKQCCALVIRLICKFGNKVWILAVQVWKYSNLEICILGNYKVQIYSRLETLNFGIDLHCKCSLMECQWPFSATVRRTMECRMKYELSHLNSIAVSDAHLDSLVREITSLSECGEKTING